MTATAVIGKVPLLRPRRTGRHRSVPAHDARQIVTRVASVLATALVILTGVVLLGMTVGPRVLHYRTATMLTGSMSPAIEPGDMIVDVAEPAVTLKVGQIVTYHIPVEDHRVESHRVTWVHVNADGSVLFRTKGDANNGADPWTARAAAGSTIWRVKTVLPFAGDVVRALRQPMVHLVLTRVVPVLLVVSVMFAIWRPRRRDAEAA